MAVFSAHLSIYHVAMISSHRRWVFMVVSFTRTCENGNDSINLILRNTVRLFSSIIFFLWELMNGRPILQSGHVRQVNCIPRDSSSSGLIYAAQQNYLFPTQSHRQHGMSSKSASYTETRAKDLDMSQPPPPHFPLTAETPRWYGKPETNCFIHARE